MTMSLCRYDGSKRNVPVYLAVILMISGWLPKYKPSSQFTRWTSLPLLSSPQCCLQ